MTSLLPPSTSSRASSPAGRRSAVEVGLDLAHRRPLALVATAGGVAAAAATLLVCLAAGVIGWFLTDGGAHGAPRDGLRTGALGWLMAHGSGVRIEGVEVTAVPLGLTLLCVWSVWRVGNRVGVSVSGHGPDAQAIADGERDLTVPVSTALFMTGYVVAAVVVTSVAATAATAPSTAHVVLWSLVLCLVVGGTAIAAGSGRAAIWAAHLPSTVRAVAHVCRRVLVMWLTVSLGAFVLALVLDFSTAANVMSQLHAGAGGAVLVVVASLLILPNAVVFAGSYVMGPGFAVGTGTLVAPSAVVLGPLPAFPMLAALPDDGPTAGWTAWLIVLAPLAALLAAVLCQRRDPTTRYEEGGVRGCAGGVAAGLVFGVVAALAGGSVGPGRMRDVAPFVNDCFLHAVTAFGIGGLVGGLAITWWQRRSLRLADDSVSGIA